MKYMTISSFPIGDLPTHLNVIIQNSDGSATSFPTVVGTPHYDAFLVQADLTDAKVQKLKTDTWYDFPKES